jgi:hypothetical protein
MFRQTLTLKNFLFSSTLFTKIFNNHLNNIKYHKIIKFFEILALNQLVYFAVKGR